MSLRQMLLRSNPTGATVQLTNQNVSHFTVSPTNASVTYRLNNAGGVNKITTVTTTLENWLLVGGTAASYDARATLTSGTLSSGTVGTWLNLGTNRDWNVSRSSVGSNTATILVEIRPAGGGSTLASATITLTADVSA